MVMRVGGQIRPSPTALTPGHGRERRSRRTEARHPWQGVRFSPARCVRFSSGVDTGIEGRVPSARGSVFPRPPRCAIRRRAVLRSAYRLAHGGSRAGCFLEQRAQSHPPLVARVPRLDLPELRVGGESPSDRPIRGVPIARCDSPALSAAAEIDPGSTRSGASSLATGNSRA
jgi:hypothetical protein